MQPHYDLTQSTMSYQPPPPPREAIQQICNILELSPDQATILLQNNGNDVNRCMEAYFTDPTGSLVPSTKNPDDRQWEDQDNVPFADDASTGAMPALSRPPSRADNYGGTGANNSTLDLSNTHAQATALSHQGLKHQQQQDDMDDEQLQEALRMSLEGGGGQESGVTSANNNGGAAAGAGTAITGTGQQFGPATKSHYDQATWSMVPVASSRELIDHPPPSKRRRIGNQPAFLRPTAGSGYLAALLTIYHSIPVAREALLLPTMQATSYGYDPLWWSGSSDENGKQISLSQSTNEEVSYDATKTTVLAEVQCLMALLSSTNRAYASVDALADLHAVRPWQRRANTPFSVIWEAWRDAVLTQQPEARELADIFCSEAKKTMEPGNDVSKEMMCVEALVIRRAGQTLTQCLDTTVWDDNTGPLENVWISYAGEVFTIRLYDGNSPTMSNSSEGDGGLLLTIPTVWYPDRYMTELREQTLQMRAELQDIQRQIYAMTTQQNRLNSFLGPGRKPIRAKEVLEATARASQNILTDRYVDHQPSDELAEMDIAGLQTQLRAVLAHMERKYDELEARKDILHKQTEELSLQFTSPGIEGQPPRLKYVLQGVSTKPNIMYIRERNNDLLGLEDDTPDVEGKHSEWIWWRIEWSPKTATGASAPQHMGPLSQADARAALQASVEAEEGSPYTVTQVSEADVIEAARTEHHSVVLVYASEKAMEFQNTPLPSALKQFVEQDNITFMKELRQEQQPDDDDADSGFASQTELHKSGDAGGVLGGNIMDDRADSTSPPTSATTLATTTELAGVHSREMTPMSLGGGGVTPSYRAPDGQPSPKRPKSSDQNAGFMSAGSLPPSYEESVPLPEIYQDQEMDVKEEKKMQEHQSKIGMYADQLMERYGNGESQGSEMSGVEQQVESEHTERVRRSLPR